MLTQRWMFQVEQWRPADEPVRATDYEVVHVRERTEVAEFVKAHHYSGTMPAIHEVFAVMHLPTAQLVGAAVYGEPMNPACFSDFPEPGTSTELCRFVLADSVPGMGETMVLADTFAHLRRLGYTGVLSHSDPVPRPTASGRLVHPGHVGIIYQGHNAFYRGRTEARWRHLLPDGKELSPRAQTKVRQLDSRWRSAAATLERHGAAPLALELEGLPFDGPESEWTRAAAAHWLDAWKAQLTRRFFHTGNHRYVWGLTRAARRHFLRQPPGPPYPEPPGGRVPPKYGRRARA